MSCRMGPEDGKVRMSIMVRRLAGGCGVKAVECIYDKYGVTSDQHGQEGVIDRHAYWRWLRSGEATIKKGGAHDQAGGSKLLGYAQKSGRAPVFNAHAQN